MIERVRKGTKVRQLSTGWHGRVVQTVQGDRFYVRVKWDGGLFEDTVFEGTRDLERRP